MTGYKMKKLFLLVGVSILLFSCNEKTSTEQNMPVQQVMNDVISRVYSQVPPEKYDSIDDPFVLDFLNDEEKDVLAKRYLYFTVNTPVTVSLMRHTEQKVIPFWLEDAGFKKTGQRVK